MRWWDGEGGNGGVDKPKFFAAHSLTGSSSIVNLNIKNTPVLNKMSYAYDAAGLSDLNFLGSAFYLALPGLPDFIPDFGTFPTNGDFVLLA